jgi:uncharacterized protein (TIGR02996 family)
MLDREPFLRAIFAAPDDDLPRLVFADFLDEQGDHAWAELIRIQCELKRSLPPHAPPPVSLAALDRISFLNRREKALKSQVFLTDGRGVSCRGWDRGFVIVMDPTILVSADELEDPVSFRQLAAAKNPWWYGATGLKVTTGKISTPGSLAAILTSPVTERVTELNLSGNMIETPRTSERSDFDGFPEFGVAPSITPSMVNVLAQSREARRLTELDLRHNGLGNDSARALIKSPHLARLNRLYLLEGNYFRERVWQQVLERFGDVVE